LSFIFYFHPEMSFPFQTTTKNEKKKISLELNPPFFICYFDKQIKTID